MTPHQPPALHGPTIPQALTYLSFGAVYYVLAVYAAGMPLQSGGPLFIWPAHGLALGTLLVAPARRWPIYLAIVVALSVLVGVQVGFAASGILGFAALNLAHPLVIALGLLKLAGPKVEIGTLRGLASFLIGMVPMVALMAMLDSAYSYVRFDLPLRQQWSLHFFSTTIGMLIVAPAVLAWKRRGYRQAFEIARERWPELLVLFVFLVIITNYVFKTPAGAPGFVPPAYLCAPFLIWAALRFGLRAATLGLAIFGLICYWHTGHGLGPFSVDGLGDVRALLNLQGFLAVTIITTLFAAALVVERHEAIHEIEEWRYRHERVIRASGSLLYDMDPVSGFVVWDGDVQSVVGTSPDQITTIRQWMERVHPDDRARLKGLREQLLTGETSHVALEYRLRRDDGEYTTLGVNGYRVVDPAAASGKRIIGFVKDVSDKVRAEQERIRLEAQLKQAEKMQAVGHLAGGIAHDFNNILGAILGYGELAQGRARDADMKRYLDTIMHAGNRAKSLVTQILSYSRAEGAQKLPVIVGPVIEETCELIRGSSPETLEVRYDGHAELAAVMGDPTRLHQLFMNLCSNGVHAMAGAGVLDVAVATEVLDMPRKVRTGQIPPGDYVRVTVKDTGHGIAPEVIDRIFEPFFTTKAAGKGTGLGLALVHSVVTEHLGFIDVESQMGLGTTFTVWLPRAPALPGEEEAPDRPVPHGRGEVVMAVDDEPEVLAALEEMLANLGYEPAGFRDSRDALAAFRANPAHYEALVSDEVMPGLTGTQLAMELRKIDPALPILIASGYGGSGFETRALSAGVNRVLKKPFRMSELGEVLGGFFAFRHR